MAIVAFHFVQKVGGIIWMMEIQLVMAMPYDEAMAHRLQSVSCVLSFLARSKLLITNMFAFVPTRLQQRGQGACLELRWSPLECSRA